MIARIWKGRTKQRDRDEYLDYLLRTGIPGYRNAEGNRGAYVLWSDEQNETEFTLISFWSSEDAIRRHVGRDVTTAVYYPKDENYLLELTPEVEHLLVPDNEQQEPRESYACKRLERSPDLGNGA